MLDYGNILIHMINTNLIVLNGINVFPFINVLKCLPALGGGSVVDYTYLIPNKSVVDFGSSAQVYL